MFIARYKFIVIFTLLCIVVGSWKFLVCPHKSKYEDMKKQAHDVERLLQERKVERARLNKLVYDLDNSPKAVEKVAREKFGLCKVNERFYKY